MSNCSLCGCSFPESNYNGFYEETKRSLQKRKDGVWPWLDGSGALTEVEEKFLQEEICSHCLIKASK